MSMEQQENSQVLRRSTRSARRDLWKENLVDDAVFEAVFDVEEKIDENNTTGNFYY